MVAIFVSLSCRSTKQLPGNSRTPWKPIDTPKNPVAGGTTTFNTLPSTGTIVNGSMPSRQEPQSVTGPDSGEPRDPAARPDVDDLVRRLRVPGGRRQKFVRLVPKGPCGDDAEQAVQAVLRLRCTRRSPNGRNGATVCARARATGRSRRSPAGHHVRQSERR